jgi:hypothetical protein
MVISYDCKSTHFIWGLCRSVEFGVWHESYSVQFSVRCKIGFLLYRVKWWRPIAGRKGRRLSSGITTASCKGLRHASSVRLAARSSQRGSFQEVSIATNTVHPNDDVGDPVTVCSRLANKWVFKYLEQLLKRPHKILAIHPAACTFSQKRHTTLCRALCLPPSLNQTDTFGHNCPSKPTFNNRIAQQHQVHDASSPPTFQARGLRFLRGPHVLR